MCLDFISFFVECCFYNSSIVVTIATIYFSTLCALVVDIIIHIVDATLYYSYDDYRFLSQRKDFSIFFESSICIRIQ